jgi:hypothetical protein
MRRELQRLYVQQGFSAAKIAKLYGLKYKSPKVAESTVLYQLKRDGIKRRDPAEHIRKVAPATVDEWVRRYRVGESLKQIARSDVDPVTVWNHLRKRGVVLRDKVEAQIQRVRKYERKPFSGDRAERAYLLGLRYGDLDVVRHGRAIRVRVSTTHPAMADLFELMFSPYGHVSRYPREAKLVGFEWTLECDLDESFSFLVSKPSIHELDTMSREEILAFLAGLFDAEGSILMHKKLKRHNPEIAFSNSDNELIEFVFVRLRFLGFASRMSWRSQAYHRAGISGRSRIGRVVISRAEDVQRFLHLFEVRHQEKVRKAGIASEFLAVDGDKSQLISRWNEFRLEIRVGRERFLEDAASALMNRKRTNGGRKRGMV